MYTVENLWREVVGGLIHVDRAQYPNVRWKAKARWEPNQGGYGAPQPGVVRQHGVSLLKTGQLAQLLIGLVIQEQLFQCCIRPKTAAVPCFLFQLQEKPVIQRGLLLLLCSIQVDPWQGIARLEQTQKVRKVILHAR